MELESRVKNRLGISAFEGTYDMLIIEYIMSAKDSILVYCNRKTLPQRIDSIIVNLTIDMMKASGDFDLVNKNPKQADSISMGDMSLKFVSSQGAAVDATILVCNYGRQLNRFRRFGVR